LEHGCPAAEHEDDDTTFCWACDRIIEAWCTGESLEVRDGVLYCRKIKKVVGEATVRNAEHDLLLIEVESLEKKLKELEKGIDEVKVLNAVEDFLRGRDFVEADRTAYRYMRAAYEVRELSDGYVVIDGEEVVGFHAAFSDFDMISSVTLCLPSILKELPSEEVVEALDELLSFKEKLAKKARFFTVKVEVVEKVRDDPKVRNVCKRLFDKDVVEVVEMMRAYNEEVRRADEERRRRWEEEKRRAEEQRRRAVEQRAEEVRKAFEKLRDVVEVTVNGRTINVKLKKFVDRKKFDEYVSIAKSLKMSFDPKTRSWVLEV